MRNGELLWGDRKIPLDFAVHDTNLQMDYSFLRGHYDSHLASRQSRYCASRISVRSPG